MPIDLRSGGGSGGSGTVTSVSVVTANGLAGTVATSTSTPTITLRTTITGVLKGNGTAISAAVAGTDYLVPAGTYFIGTTSNAFNRASASQTLTGISIDGNASTVTTNANLTGDITSVGNATTYNGVVPINKGGTGQITAVLSFNALSPVTTRGDIITRGATNNQRLALGATGTFLISDGTDLVYSTSTIPTSAGATANKVLLSNGTNYVLSTPTFPNASATSGKLIISDGTNWIASTPTFPNSATGTGTILRADGTNWVATTATYPSTTTANQILYSTATSVIGGSANLTYDGTTFSTATSSFSSSATTPLVIGGAGTTSTLTLKTTTGVGTTNADMIFQVGSNGGTEAMRILNSAFVGINKAIPTARFHIGSTSGGANSGMALEQLANGSAAASYIPVDFMVPTTGLIGQFLATASNYSNSNAIAINSMAILAEATSGQLALGAIGSSGFISFITGGIAVANEGMRLISSGKLGIGVTAPTAVLHLKAGTATADTAPIKLTSGTLTTSAVAGQYEYNGNHYITNAILRFPLGGNLFNYVADVSVGGAETDIFTSTLIASTFNANNEKIVAMYSGNFVTVGTELTQLKVYFAGTAIWDSTGVAPSTGTTSWRVYVELIRVSSTVVRYAVSLNTTGASGYVYATSGELTGLTLSGTNIIKITGTSSGVGSGAGDIVGKMGYINFQP